MAPVQNTTEIDILKQEALTLAAEPSKSFYRFACALWDAHDADHSFLGQLERDANISRRKLFYMSAVGRFLRQHDVSPKDVENIGWTKTEILARHFKGHADVSRKDINAKLRLAMRTTAHELPAALKKRPVATGRTRSLLLRLPVDQYALLEAALLQRGAQKHGKGLTGKEEAIVKLALSAAFRSAATRQ